ncbi:MAG: hypothetical protein COB30_012625 [Ectothiorhodospiraceae bacterium]|nr:hypothetical protein [Ectothiorhodospiraceae bacterium]
MLGILGIRKYIIGMFVGLIVGLWLGVNIGHDRALLSNPFAEPGLQQKAKSVALDAMEKAKKAAQDSLSN